jgi:hypothetical protein
MNTRAGAAFARNLYSILEGREDYLAHMSHDFQDSRKDSAEARTSRRFPRYGSFDPLWTN